MTETTIRPEFVEIAVMYHGGQSSVLYRVASTGRIILDPAQRPMKPVWSSCLGTYHHEPMTDAEWAWTLWGRLADELADVVHRLDGETLEDSPRVMWFQRFAQREANRLESNHAIMI